MRPPAHVFSCVVESSWGVLITDRLALRGWFCGSSVRILFLRCARGVSSAPFELHCSIIQRNVARLVLQAAARGTAARSDATDVYSFSKISLAAIIVFKLAHLPVARDGLGDYSTM